MLALRKSLLLTVAIAAVLSLATARPCAAAVTPTALTIPEGCTFSRAVRVNTDGTVLGLGQFNTLNGTEQRGILWRDGTPYVLEPLDPIGGVTYTRCEPYAMNASGVVVGYSSSGGPTPTGRATRWIVNSDGTVTKTDLGVYPGDGYSEALAVNANGQILCRSSFSYANPGDFLSHWFLWEEGKAPVSIQMSDPAHQRFNAKSDEGGFLPSCMLLPDGSVVGTMQTGSWDTSTPPYWIPTGAQAVVWTPPDATHPDGTVTPLSPAEANFYVAFVFANDAGLVACRDNHTKLWVYDPNPDNPLPGFHELPDPPVDPSLWVTDSTAMAVNEVGQVVVAIQVEDAYGNYSMQMWIWDARAGDWTYQVPLDSLSLPGTVFFGIAAINGTGKLACSLIMELPDGSTSVMAFFWTLGDAVAEVLDPLAGYALSLAIGLNDSGLVVGATADSLATENVAACTWSTPAHSSPLVISDAAVSTRNGRTYTVTVTISNSSTTDTIRNLTVTAASLGGVDTNSTLPILFGSIKPGASKQCKLQFKSIASGQQFLNIQVTSSLGVFSSTLPVSVP